jgi:hypothetical protein
VIAAIVDVAKGGAGAGSGSDGGSSASASPAPTPPTAAHRAILSALAAVLYEVYILTEASSTVSGTSGLWEALACVCEAAALDVGTKAGRRDAYRCGTALV